MSSGSLFTSKSREEVGALPKTDGMGCGGGASRKFERKVAKVCFPRGDFLEACFLGEWQKRKEEKKRKRKKRSLLGKMSVKVKTVGSARLVSTSGNQHDLQTLWPHG